MAARRSLGKISLKVSYMSSASSLSYSSSPRLTTQLLEEHVTTALPGSHMPLHWIGMEHIWQLSHFRPKQLIFGFVLPPRIVQRA